MKDSFYFPHDVNALHDPKISALVKDFGMEGYGIYWAIIEILHDQKDGKLEKFPKLFEGLAFQFKIKNEALLEAIEAMLKQYFLLQEDENYIWSDRVHRNLQERKMKYQCKVEAGRLGGIKSGISRSKDNKNEALLEANEALLEANELKKRKEKKIYNIYIPYEEIINDLNKCSGKKYKHNTEKTKSYILARWKEGWKIDDFKTVNKHKCEEWKDTDYERYLRPETLYGNKFESYLNAAPSNQKPKENLEEIANDYIRKQEKLFKDVKDVVFTKSVKDVFFKS